MNKGERVYPYVLNFNEDMKRRVERVCEESGLDKATLLRLQIVLSTLLHEELIDEIQETGESYEEEFPRRVIRYVQRGRSTDSSDFGTNGDSK